MFDLPQHAVGAKTVAWVWVVERVDSRNAIIQNIQNCNHFQFARLPWGCCDAKLHQTGIDPALQQELGVLVDAVLVHAAPRVSGALVAQVELVVFLDKAQLEHPSLQAAMSRPGPALASVGCKLRCQNSQRHTGAAAITVGSVGEHTTAPETLAHQIRVGGVVDQVTWGCHL